MKTKEQISRGEFLRYTPTLTSKHAMLTIDDMDILVSKIYTQAQQDLVNEASEGFEEWNRKSFLMSSDYNDHGYPFRKEAWQAARLSMMKENESFKKEALEVINKIKESHDHVCDHYLQFEEHANVIGINMEPEAAKRVSDFWGTHQVFEEFLAKHSEEKGD